MRRLPPGTLVAPGLTARGGVAAWVRRQVVRAGGPVAVALTLMLWLAAPCAATAAAAGTGAVKPTEAQLKATFLFNFVLFTDWPVSAFAGSDAPLVIGVLGEDPLGPALDEVTAGESIRGRRLLVRRLEHGADVTGCHVLFVSRSEREQLAALLTRLRDRPVLTIGDTERFCEQGGMMSLVLMSDGKVKPVINPDTARSAGLTVSSRLLNLPMIRLVRSDR